MPVLIPDYLEIPAPTDDICTHMDIRGKGGYRVVADLLELNAIVPSARKYGMLVFVQSDGHYYRLGIGLTNLDWEDLGESLGGNLRVTQIQASDFTLEMNRINLVDTTLNTVNATIPTGMIAGAKINITDAKNSFSLEKPLTILHNGYRVNGVLDDFQIPIGKSSITFLAIDDGGTELNWVLLDAIPFINERLDHEVGMFIRGNIPASVSANNEVGWTSVLELVDSHNAFTPSNGRFTAPKKGWYVVNGYYNTNMATNSGITAFVNNLSRIPVIGLVPTSAGLVCFSGGLFLNQGDVLTIRPTASYSASSGGNSMSIIKVN
jgi:hypothetical protein